MEDERSRREATTLVDVLDRILDKGIVIDAWVLLVGVDLLSIEARIVVASIETYLSYADQVSLTSLGARPPLSAAAKAQ